MIYTKVFRLASRSAFYLYVSDSMLLDDDSVFTLDSNLPISVVQESCPHYHKLLSFNSGFDKEDVEMALDEIALLIAENDKAKYFYYPDYCTDFIKNDKLLFKRVRNLRNGWEFIDGRSYSKYRYPIQTYVLNQKLHFSMKYAEEEYTKHIKMIDRQSYESGLNSLEQQFDYVELYDKGNNFFYGNYPTYECYVLTNANMLVEQVIASSKKCTS